MHAVDVRHAAEIEERRRRRDDLAQVMLAVVAAKAEPAAHRLQDNRRAIIILAEVHHDMRVVGEQGARHARLQCGQPVRLAHAREVDDLRHRLGLLIRIARQLDAHAAVDVADE